jgi:hypothetical protein
MNINLHIRWLVLEGDEIAIGQRHTLQVAGNNPMQFGQQRSIGVWRNRS